VETKFFLVASYTHLTTIHIFLLLQLIFFFFYVTRKVI